MQTKEYKNVSHSCIGSMRVQNPVITTVMVGTLVSTCAAEHSFSGMKRLKTPLRSTMSEERLFPLAILHITQGQECGY